MRTKLKVWEEELGELQGFRKTRRLKKRGKREAKETEGDEEENYIRNKSVAFRQQEASNYASTPHLP